MFLLEFTVFCSPPRYFCCFLLSKVVAPISVAAPATVAAVDATKRGAATPPVATVAIPDASIPAETNEVDIALDS